MTRKQINAIFTLAIYHFADLCYSGKQAQRLLMKAKLGPWDKEEFSSKEDQEQEYAAWALDQYKDIMREHVAEHWPEEWQWTADYWGAKGLFKNPGWNAPKSGGHYVGDACGQMAWFDSMEALEEYTEDALKEEGLISEKSLS